MQSELSERVTKLAEILREERTRLTKEQKAEYIKSLQENGIDPKFIQVIFEILHEEEFINQEGGRADVREGSI